MTNIKNIGTIQDVKDGIATATGLSELGYNHLVKIKTKKEKVFALALDLEDDKVGLVILGDYKNVSAGDKIEALKESLNINVSEQLVGNVIDPLGFSKKGTKDQLVTKGKNMPLENIAPGVMERKKVSRPLNTGITAIDSMFPIGKGQRELIIGDKKTGKTAVALDTVLNQKGKDVYCIYVSIGQKASRTAQIYELFKSRGALDYTIIVEASASDPASMQYIAPYAGCAIGEYFAQQGKDALIIYDDLTRHAWAYREISLLLQRPPGREAYPGDIFYLHSRLLERALQYSDKLKGGSLTALPIIETQGGDVSAYIPTNVISITDGQIYFEPELFNAGQRPAINIGLSVSRVGGDAQIKPMKQIAGKLKLDLAQYQELKTFAQFGSELDEETKKKLNRGEKVLEILKQPLFAPIPIENQIAILFAVTEGFLDKVKTEKIKSWIDEFLLFLTSSQNEILKRLQKDKKLKENEIEKLRQIVSSFANKQTSQSSSKTENQSENNE